MSFCLVQGCQKQPIQSASNIYSHQEAEINQLKVQISKIEKILIAKPKEKSKTKLQGKASPIKSITFRIGSNDDRLRIYWNDGKITDLPCTKEQSIWACG
tara:strand:+ start:260 stop:559 length:300 start_codon:yes stop_codon:yes gene_type:complete